MQDERSAAAGWRERLAEWLGAEVVVDSIHPFVALGTLVGIAGDCLQLADADLHDLRDTDTTRELYVVKAARHGVQANRRELLLRLDHVFAVSPLAGVVAG